MSFGDVPGLGNVRQENIKQEGVRRELGKCPYGMRMVEQVSIAIFLVKEVSLVKMSVWDVSGTYMKNIYSC